MLKTGMDSKTPPIPLKLSEKPQPKKAEHVADVFLPPLTPYPNHRLKNKPIGTSTRSQEPPCAIQHQDYRKKRPYRVLHIGATPLMHACQQGDRARVLRLLKEQEETIGYRDRTLRSALHYCMDAATCGAVATTAPELVNAPDSEGHTPLHLAVIAGDTQLVAVLLANGADVNAKDLEGHSVLHWATVCGEAECVRLVLAAGARPSTSDLRGGSPLHYAAQCCGVAATAELAVPKKVGLKILQTLLEFGADVNAKDEDGRQPILWAASAGSVEAVLALARAGGSAAAGTSDKDGLTALHCAASRGHARCVEALVNLCGSQPDHVDDNGCSALHYAATLGHADATALILKLGADPNRQDRKGRTPALCAAAKGQLETLKILTQHGGSLHARTVRGTGIGHEAVASGRIELIKWLAKKRPSTLDVATHDGKTPLHVAALHGHLDACKILLDHGARINAILRTSKGSSMTPLDAALYRGHRDCAKLIQMHGGSTAQQLKAHKTVPNKAKVQMKRAESSSASDSSPCRQDGGHRHPELYYEERWIERRTRRKGNLKKLTRQDSRSFSEEEVRLSKTSSRKDERRTRSESSRYDDNGEHNLRKKRSRRKSRHKHDHSDSSNKSDSCECFHDDDGNETAGRRRHARKRQEKDKSKSSNEVEAKDNSRKEDDDDRSVSDDSLEVIVVKKSLEKKCEKVMSGRRSKTPKECTKETKMTKTHKCSSKKTSKSSKSRMSDNDEKVTGRDDLPNKGRSNVELAESAARTSPEKDEDKSHERLMESQYERDATDSTSQENVEQVVVTAMVHKDQLPDTPKATLAEQVDSDATSRKKTEETKETAGDVSSSDKCKMISSDKTEMRTARGEELQMQKSSQFDEEAEGALDMLRRQQATEAEASTQDPRHTGDFISEKEDTSKGGEKIDKKFMTSDEQKNSHQELTTTSALMKHIPDLDQEDQKLSDSATSKPDAKTDPQVIREQKGGVSTERTVKAIAKEKFESTEDAGSREDKDLNKYDGAESSEKMRKDKKERMEAERLNDDLDDSAREKSPGLSSADESRASILYAEEPSPRRMESSRDKKSVDVEESGRELEMITGAKDFRYIDDSSSSSPKSSKLMRMRRSRPSTGKGTRTGRSSSTRAKKYLSEKRSPDRSAIIAVLDSPEWDEDELIEKEIRDALGEEMEHDTEHEEDEIGVMRVLPSTSEEEIPSAGLGAGSSRIDTLPQVQSTTSKRLVTIEGPEEDHRERPWRKQRRDSGGRDSGIEPSPRVSRIPRRRNARCSQSMARQQALNMETITRDVQISLRRYHLERKIFFQLMELKRLQIRHGKTNEHVLVKRQVDTFHKSGMTGPTLGVVKYDRPLTFRQFEAFLYEQLRRLQGRPTTPDFCTEAKQCTQKTHRCHHATSAYTSIPVYTYLGGGIPDRVDHLPKIESRGRGQMTMEVTHGEEKQVIALPAERFDRTKRYFVTFTVRGEMQDVEKPKSSSTIQRNAKSV